jgi:NitT/TauT family transport system permease protein
VGRYLVTAAGNGTLAQASLVTARRLFVGYAIGLGLGLPLGFLMARFRLFADTIGVLALGMQTLPSVCWVPLALLWFGQSEGAMLFVTVMGTLWSIVIATDHGIRSVPPIYARAARTMGSRRLHILVFVTLPAALPSFLSGMKQGWAFAWRSLMAAEIYVTVLTGLGLGHLLHYGRELLAMDQVLGVMFVVVLVGLAVDQALFAPAERLLHRRWGRGQ